MGLPRRFQHGSKQILALIISKGKCNRSIAWLGSSGAECSHGKQENLGSSPGRATFF